MTDDERARVYRLCYDSKRGRENWHREDHAFIQKMFRMDPDGYSEVSDEAGKQAVEDYVAPFWAAGGMKEHPHD